MSWSCFLHVGGEFGNLRPDFSHIGAEEFQALRQGFIPLGEAAIRSSKVLE
jgi:hypothetical protein